MPIWARIIAYLVTLRSRPARRLAIATDTKPNLHPMEQSQGASLHIQRPSENVNLVYSSCGCVESGNELEDEDRFYWTTREDEAAKAFHQMTDLCKSHIAEQIDIIESDPATFQFDSPYTFVVAWLRIPSQRFAGIENPFEQLPALAAADPDLRERLSELIVKLHAGGRDSSGELSVDQEDGLEEVDSLFD